MRNIVVSIDFEKPNQISSTTYGKDKLNIIIDGKNLKSKNDGISIIDCLSNDKKC